MKGTGTRRALRALRREQDGQTLILAALMMFVVMAFAAYAIDTAVWHHAHHQDQVAADAASLAAAQCLANAGTGKTCASGTDTTDAITAAQQIASDNGVTISSSNITFSPTSSPTSVSVTAPSQAPSLFAQVVGINGRPVRANATASFTAGSTGCTSSDQSAGDCYAIYAANQSCDSSDGFITGSAGIDITGEVHSQGALNFYSGGGSYDFSSITASSGNCYSGSVGGSISYPENSTMTGAKPTLGGDEASGFWPDDYSKFFTACSGASCTGPDGTPSWCDYAATDYTFSSGALPSGGVECAYGTGTASTPSTWTGGFTFDNGPNYGTSSSPAALTMIGGYIDLAGSGGNGVNIKAATGGDGCIAYAEQAIGSYGDPSVNVQNGNYVLDGDIFAPLGEIQIYETASTGSFLEALDVELDDLSGSFTGDGPTSGAAAPGSVSLTQ